MRQHTGVGALACVTVLGSVLVAAGLSATSAAAAVECLTSPRSDGPAGYHWFYQTDRVHNRKCWYLKKVNRGVKRPVAVKPATPVGSTGHRRRAAGPGHPRLNREALFEEFLRWQKQQENQR